MSDDLEALGPLARRVLDAEQRRPLASGDVAERLLARVAGTVAAGSVASGAGTAAAAKAGSSAAAVGLTAKAAPWIALAFVAGGGAGAALHAVATPRAVVTSPPAMTSTLSPPPVATPTSLPAPPEPTASVASPPSVLPSGRPTATIAKTAPSVASADVDLAAERSLIDRVRMAIARGQSGAALEAVGEHEARFARGRLVEEREALAIQALAQAGRLEAAEKRADRFRKTYPKSVFLPAVDVALPKSP